MQIQDLFRNKNAFATSLMTYMTSAYGTEFIEWDPTTVELQLKDDLNMDVPGYTLDKIQAASSLFTSNLFHLSLETFIPLCLTFSRGVAITSTLVPANMYDLAWGVTEARLLEGSDFDQEGFSHNIRMYTGAILDLEGLYDPPKCLDFAEYGKGRKEKAYNAIANRADDYQLFYSMQQEKRDNINSALQERFIKLFTELKALPLKDLNGMYLDNILNKLTVAVPSEE